MLLAVLADIHGNQPALQVVLAEIEPLQPNGFLIAGDFAGGPQDNEVIRLLRPLPVWAVRGPSDSRLLRLADRQAPPAWLTARQYAMLRWSWRRTLPQTLAYLRGLPAQRTVTLPGAAPIRLVHGSPRSPDEGIYPQRDPASLSGALKLVDDPVLVCGHTHEPWIRRQGRRLALNPGSVGVPLNGDKRSQYALLYWEEGAWQPELHSVTYDLELVRRAYIESGLLGAGGALAKASLLSREMGRDVCKAFLDYAKSLADQAGRQDEETIPDDIWDEAERTFDWGTNNLDTAKRPVGKV